MNACETNKNRDFFYRPSNTNFGSVGKELKQNKKQTIKETKKKNTIKQTNRNVATNANPFK